MRFEAAVNHSLRNLLSFGHKSPPVLLGGKLVPHNNVPARPASPPALGLKKDSNADMVKLFYLSSGETE